MHGWAHKSMKIYAKSTLRDDFGNLKMDFPKNCFGLVPAIGPSQLKMDFPESSEWGFQNRGYPDIS